MLHLSRGTHFLTLTRDVETRNHTVAIYSRFDQAIRNWQLGTRISPIFPLDSAVPTLHSEQFMWMTFFGPIHPGELCDSSLKQIFVTLGLYDILVISDTKQAREEVRGFANAHHLHWEEWELSGNKIVKEFNVFKKKEIESIFKKINPIINNYMEENSVNLLFDSKNIFMGSKKLKIDEDILKKIKNQLK